MGSNAYQEAAKRIGTTENFTEESHKNINKEIEAARERTIKANAEMMAAQASQLTQDNARRGGLNNNIIASALAAQANDPARLAAVNNVLTTALNNQTAEDQRYLGNRGVVLSSLNTNENTGLGNKKDVNSMYTGLDKERQAAEIQGITEKTAPAIAQTNEDYTTLADNEKNLKDAQGEIEAWNAATPQQRLTQLQKMLPEQMALLSPQEQLALANGSKTAAVAAVQDTAHRRTVSETAKLNSKAGPSTSMAGIVEKAAPAIAA